ncbi:type III pantothenate kinase [Nonlabens xiamenensis]|uniref:type III pantothenate kinase n=1 Tax=Nonlabens xiamenensis TaxID=2341043 RepID=UPI000F60A467|nr:type III pantothenate kinase [Nonlabens xiamenensis]
MIVVVDVGNTSIKLAVMQQQEPLLLYRTDSNGLQPRLTDIKEKYPDIATVAICAVGKMDAAFRQVLEQYFTEIFELRPTMHLPFTNTYQSETIGMDRLALMAGAQQLRKEQQAVLVIDAGTCITYDLLNKDNQYLGGAISPGLRLRYESLHNFTARLPLLEKENVEDFIGKTTASSMHSGVINGATQEIQGVINQYKERFDHLEIFITGGDADLLVKQLKNRFFATPFLMLQGIEQLYNFNHNL